MSKCKHFANKHNQRAFFQHTSPEANSDCVIEPHVAFRSDGLENGFNG